MLGLLRRAVDEFGQTVVMVTHDPDAAAVADRSSCWPTAASCRRARRGADEVVELMKAVA